MILHAPSLVVSCGSGSSHSMHFKAILVLILPLKCGNEAFRGPVPVSAALTYTQDSRSRDPSPFRPPHVFTIFLLELALSLPDISLISHYSRSLRRAGSSVTRRHQSLIFHYKSHLFISFRHKSWALTPCLLTVNPQRTRSSSRRTTGPRLRILARRRGSRTALRKGHTVSTTLSTPCDRNRSYPILRSSHESAHGRAPSSSRRARKVAAGPHR